MQTRTRILACTLGLIDEVPYRELTSALVMQRLGLSPSAFYRYFSEINDAILELTATMRSSADEVADLVAGGSWSRPDDPGTALAVIGAMAAFWGEHRSLYRVTELCADEGDRRFADVKAVTFAGLTAAFEAVVTERKDAGAHDPDVDPYALACVLVTMLIHTVARESAFDHAGVSPEAIRSHLGRLLVAGVTGGASSLP